MKLTLLATVLKHQAFVFLSSILVPMAAMAYTEHSGGTINSETWGAETHYVSGNIVLNDNEVLTIMPGAVIKFAPGTLMTIRGTLRAVGAAANFIVFTSRDDNIYGETILGSDGSPSPGDWTGIYLYGDSYYEGIGEFDYCRIRYGGGAGGTSANVYFHESNSGYFTNSISEKSAIDGIRIADCSPQIIDSTIIDNVNDGLYASGSGAAIITGNTFTGNGHHAVYLNQTAIPPNISDNTGSGNGTNGLVLAGTVSVNQNWSSVPGFPIVLLSEVMVNNDISLTVAAGTIIKFGSSVQLYVRGTLDANGSAGNPVVFTSLKDDEYDGDTNGDGDSSSATPGDWTGIYLYGDSYYEGIGEFDYCRIRYGGGAGGTSANVYFHESNSGYFTNSISEKSAIDGIRIADCSPQIIDSTIIDNVNDGLYASGGGAVTTTGNTFTGNGHHAVYLNQTDIPPNISGNTGSGNGTNGLVLAGTVSVNQNWSSVPGFPIVLLSEVMVNNDISLTVAAGTIIKFGSSVQLYVRGTLDANGSAGNPVVFTSLKDDEYDGDTNGDGDSSSATPGDWTGIYLYGDSYYEGIGEFDYCRIRYGGGAGGTSANVYFHESNSGYFTNSISEKSAIDGIRIADCSPQISNSTFSKNTNYGLTVSSGLPRVTNCIFWGDGVEEISGSLPVTFSDVQGGYAGAGNINKDPLFLDPDSGDYRLDVCSPAIDAGDPVENLTADYIFGDFILSVDRVTAVTAGDPIWITDGENYEIDEVVGTTASTVTVLNGFFNSYAVVNQSYLFTATSDFTGEPEPNGRRINMGAYGGGSEAAPSFVCRDDDELAADFGPNGLWHYDGASWSKLATWDPDDDLAGWSGGLAVDFGGEGLWNHDGTSWSKKTSWNPGSGGLAGWSGGLAVDFDANGLWYYDGSSWSFLTSWNPEGMAGWNGSLAVDFGNDGLWSYDGSSWRQLTSWNPEGMAGWNGSLAVDFGNNGLWSYDGSSWRQLTSWNPTGMSGWSGGLAVDFDAEGLWSHDGSSWRQLTTWNPTAMSGWGSGLAVDFGVNGLWNNDGSSWSMLTSWHCENLSDVDLN